MFDEPVNGAPKADALRRPILALMGRTDIPYSADSAF
jgi:hypothetical protein